MDTKNLRTDVNRELAGVWVQVDEDTSVLVARYRNDKHRKYLKNVLEPHKRMIRNNSLSDKVLEKIELDAMSKHILLDWKGMSHAGKALKYSQKEALKILSDPGLKWFREFVQEAAEDFELYRAEDLEEAKENVKK